MKLSWLQEVREAVQSINLPARHFAGDGTVDIGVTDVVISRDEIENYLNNIGIFERGVVHVPKVTITKDDAISGAVFFALHVFVEWKRLITNITRDDLLKAEATGSIGKEVEIPSPQWNQLVEYATKLANLAVGKSTRHGASWWRFSTVAHDRRGFPVSVNIDVLKEPWTPFPSEKGP